MTCAFCFLGRREGREWFGIVCATRIDDRKNDMKVSLKWLSEYVDVPSDTKAFCDRLDLTGTGVEEIGRAHV